MAQKRKTQRARKPPALCLAIQTLRKKTGLTQADFSRDLEVSSMSLSRYETGITIPRSRTTLNRLAAVAAEAGATVEEEVFRQAAMALPGGPSKFQEGLTVPVYTPLEWRLMQGIRLAQAYFPEEAKAAEQVLGMSLDVVDEILADAALGERRLTSQVYAQIESQLNERAAQKLFKDKFTREGNIKQ
jgi:transcriptional regulator with XRE-family HTH domain